MKSKAHMKKCLELGVSMTSVDDTETEEAGIYNLAGGLFHYVCFSFVASGKISLDVCFFKRKITFYFIKY